MTRHPMQNMVKDENGVIRFQENKIVNFLLDYATARGCSLNELIVMAQFSNEDWIQFNQLIGYSVSGYGDLSFIPENVVQEADEKAAKLLK